MIVVVNDANILIDLIKLQLIEAFFNINWEFHSTNLIIENELYDVQKEELQPYVENGKLIIQELDVEDMISIDHSGTKTATFRQRLFFITLCSKTGRYFGYFR